MPAIVPPEDASDPAPPRARSRSVRAPTVVVFLIAVGIVAAAAIGIGRSPVAPRPSASASARVLASGGSAAPSAPASASASASASSPPALVDRGYLVSLAELQDRAARAAAGEQPEATALADLLAWSSQAVGGEPNPQEPLKIPGTTGPFVDDSATAYGLALAWGASGDVRYATAAHDFVMAWAHRTKTLIRACPTAGDCQTSLIVSRTAPGFVFAADLLVSSGVFSATDDATFRDWIRTVILPAASERTNNWGDAGAFLRAVATDYLGDSSGFTAAVDKWKAQLDLIAPDGHIPEEVRRDSSGLSYTQEALLYKLAVARIAERRGIDLWSYKGTGGGTLQAAVELAARYQADSTGWPWAKHVDTPDPGPGLEIAYAHWPNPVIASLLGPVRPLGWPGHSAIRWTTLTNGVPFGG